jgi:hypothetical protein
MLTSLFLKEPHMCLLYSDGNCSACEISPQILWNFSVLVCLPSLQQSTQDYKVTKKKESFGWQFHRFQSMSCGSVARQNIMVEVGGRGNPLLSWPRKKERKRKGSSSHYLLFVFFVLSVLGFKLRVSCLLGKCSTAWATPPTIFGFGFFSLFFFR